ncbi:MAG: TetR/AcrR family transcriptional regulator [Proteobacteria bacterium]|nr:TetR/AcrR family transcriptional regulator [Pseudomonadota bacterium]MBU1059126.1 TetR/AcrR family transcriptional regulator [Pseudomonadota bacterium]
MHPPRSRKEAILQTATRFFSEKGFRDTSMSEIAKVTGVADGTIFYHFKTKGELFLAVLKNFKESIIGELEAFEATAEFSTGLDMVEGTIAFYFSLAERMEERFLLLHRHYPYKLAMDNPHCRKYLEEIYTCFINLFSQAILQGQKDGSIRELHSKKQALLLFTLVDGLVRLETYNLFKAGPLYNDLIDSCRYMLENR